MNRLRRFSVATILTLVLALPVFAGEIECGVVSPPPPQQVATTGDIHCGFILTSETSGTETASIDPVTETVLSVLQGLLSLF